MKRAGKIALGVGLALAVGAGAFLYLPSGRRLSRPGAPRRRPRRVLLGEVRTERLVRSIEAVGTVSAIDSVTAGTGITILDALDPIALRFTVPEQEVGRIAPGTAVAATSPAFSGRTFAAEARALDVRINPASRTLKVEARPTRTATSGPGC